MRKIFKILIAFAAITLLASGCENAKKMEVESKKSTFFSVKDNDSTYRVVKFYDDNNVCYIINNDTYTNVISCLKQ